MVSFYLTTVAATALTLTFASTVSAADSCATAPYAKCGSNPTGVTNCCPSNQYCIPWDAGFYQCIQKPAQCSVQYSNVDLYGNDIKTLYGLQPDACCDECSKLSNCVAYTFVNSNPGQPACYLKYAVGAQTPSTGAVSGLVNGRTGGSPPPPPPTPTPTPTTTAPPTTTPPPSNCATPNYGSCGNSNGATCCPSGFYCQPWNPTYYQCILPPTKCSKQYTDVDLYGNDIKTVNVNLPSECCDACANTQGCKAYTYVNNNPGQPACYLKSAVGAQSKLVGGVSGILN